MQDSRDPIGFFAIQPMVPEGRPDLCAERTGNKKEDILGKTVSIDRSWSLLESLRFKGFHLFLVPASFKVREIARNGQMVFYHSTCPIRKRTFPRKHPLLKCQVNLAYTTSGLY